MAAVVLRHVCIVYASMWTRQPVAMDPDTKQQLKSKSDDGQSQCEAHVTPMAKRGESAKSVIVCISYTREKL